MLHKKSKIKQLLKTDHFVTLKVVTNERIGDVYYYVSAFKRIKRYLLRPELLDNFAETVKEDID